MADMDKGDGTSGRVSTEPFQALATKTLFSHWTLWLPALGGALMLIHFWRIGYAPSLSFADLGTVLGGLLLICGAGVFALFGLWTMPLLTMHWWVEGQIMRGPPRPVPVHERLSERARAARNRRTLRGKRAKTLDPSVLRRSFAAGSLPSFFTASLAAMALYAAVIFIAYAITPNWIANVVVAVFFTALCAAVLLTLAVDTSVLRRRLRGLRKQKGQWALLCLIYMGTWPILLLPFLAMGTDYLSEQWQSLVISIFMLPFLHWFMFAIWRVEWRESWQFRAVSLMLVLVSSGLPLRLIDSAMSVFGLGMLRNVDLVLTARGCEIVHAAWPERACAPDHRGMTEAGAYRLERVDVLTRIGSHYYIAPAGGLDDKTLPRFTIPSEDVMSWVRMPEISIGETGK